MTCFFISYIITCTYKTSLLLSINNQYLSVLLCWGDLPRRRAMVLPFYSKFIVQFQELVEISYIKFLLAYCGQNLLASPPPLKLVKV